MNTPQKTRTNPLRKLFNWLLKCFWIVDIHVINGPRNNKLPDFDSERYKIMPIQDVNPEVIDAFISDPTNSYRWNDLIHKRLEDLKNYHGLVFFDTKEKRIAYICWIALTDYVDDDLDFTYPIDKHNGALFLNAYTVPKYRGQGIHKLMMAKRINVCAKLGRRRVFMAVESSNIPARRASRHFSFVRWKRLVGVKGSRRCLLTRSVTD